MELSVQGAGPATPFLRARDVFETEYDLTHPVTVQIQRDPDERTWVAHREHSHVLNISQSAANSAMARELALHEFAHMYRYESEHPSHIQSTAEAIFLACGGRRVAGDKITHCYQIANHMKDIYADDITLDIGPGDKVTRFLESELASAIANRRSTPDRFGSIRVSPDNDSAITAINAAFALGLLERNRLVERNHRIYDLAYAAANDAPAIDIRAFKERFRSLESGPDPSSYRKTLVDIIRNYVSSQPEPAAD